MKNETFKIVFISKTDSYEYHHEEYSQHVWNAIITSNMVCVVSSLKRAYL